MSQKGTEMNTSKKPIRRSHTPDPQVSRHQPPKPGVALHLRAMHLATAKQLGEGQ